MVRYVRVVTQGIPTIVDGRIFFIATAALELDDNGTRNEWRAPVRTEVTTLCDVPCVEHVAGSDMPTLCPHCAEMLKYSVPWHSENWMMGVFACPNHPLEIWVDYYPKRAPNWTQDVFNALPHDIHNNGHSAVANARTLRNQVIANEDDCARQQEQMRRDAPLLFKLTLDGLVPIEVGIATHIRNWWQQFGRANDLRARFA